MLNKEESTESMTLPALWGELVGINAELKVLVFAMNHPGELDSGALSELPYVGERISERLNLLSDRCGEMLPIREATIV